MNLKSVFKNNRNIGKFFSDHIGFYIGKLDLSNNEEKFREDFENFYLQGNSVQPKIRYYDKKNKLNVSIEFKFLSKFQKYIDESKDLIKDIKNNFKIYKILKVFLNVKLFQIFFGKYSFSLISISICFLKFPLKEMYCAKIFSKLFKCP